MTMYFRSNKRSRSAAVSRAVVEALETRRLLSEAPFGGTAAAIPGKIEAENYDTGGEGVAYHDLTAANEGGQYRLTEGVDVETCTDTGGGFDVGHVQPTEWIQYTFNAASGGNFAIQSRMATLTGGTFHYSIDGTTVGGEETLANTGGWQTYTTLTSGTFAVTPGQHILRITFDSSTPTGQDFGNVNWMNFVAVTGESPFGGTPWPVPGTIDFDNYDLGGSGVAYNTLTTTNQGGQYRNDSVSIEVYGDTDTSGNGFDVGHVQPGEWLKYTVNAPTAGTYTINSRVASLTGGTFHYEVDGTTVGGEVTLMNTGGWQTYTTIGTTSFNLTAGQHVIRMVVDSAAVAGQDVGNFNWFQVVNQAVTIPTISVAATTPVANEVTGTPAAFTITRTGVTNSALTVNFTMSGTAISGTDYTSVGTSVIIPAGQASALVTITPINDNKNDGTETATLTLAPNAAYTVAALPSATVSIVDAASAANSIVSLSLVNADTGVPIPGFEILTNNETINLSQLGATNISVLATTNPATIGSVQFSVNGVNIHNDNNPPYAMLGNNGVVYSPWNPGDGAIAISARPWTGTNATGTGGITLTLNLNFTGAPVVNGWSSITAPPMNYDEGQTATVNGKIYELGGFFDPAYDSTTKAAVYDPVANLWAPIASMPETMTHGSTVVVGTKIWVVGSFTNNENGPSSPDVWIYDTVANTWTAGPALPSNAGAAGGIGLVNNKIYYFTGLTRNASNTFVNTNEVIDLDLGNIAAGWQQLKAFPNPRNHLASAVVNGVIYAIGGQNIKDETAGEQTEVDAYNIATDTWTQVASLPIPLGHIATSAVVYNGTILIVDGETLNKAIVNTVYQYTPSTNTWVNQTAWATPSARKSPIVALIGNTLFAIAGGTPDPTIASSWSRLLS